MIPSLEFAAWLEHTTGKATGQPQPDQIGRLDRAIRKLAATDPWYHRSQLLQAYTKGLPLPRVDAA